MILGVGVDVIKIDRIKQSVESGGKRFLDRVFTEGEIAYCRKKKDPYPSFAARFAAKEAFVKALPYDTPVSLKEIEVLITAIGKPAIKVHGKVSRIVEDNYVSSAHLSLSHEKDYAVAVVVLEKKTEDSGLCNPLFTDGCMIEDV